MFEGLTCPWCEEPIFGDSVQVGYDRMHVKCKLNYQESIQSYEEKLELKTKEDLVAHSIYCCDGCKYWSEYVAFKIGLGPMKAMCLNSDISQYQCMVHNGCEKFEKGRAIDDTTKYQTKI